MSESNFDRRRFHELSAAALGGLMVGCSGGTNPVPSKKIEKTGGETAAVNEKHLCRGLNDCKGQSKSAKNECRGQGDCATLASHDCGGHNECKEQGGCGEAAGLNECKGKGGCHVPLMESAWNTIRKRLEDKWSKGNTKFSPAPEMKTPEKKV